MVQNDTFSRGGSPKFPVPRRFPFLPFHQSRSGAEATMSTASHTRSFSSHTSSHRSTTTLPLTAISPSYPPKPPQQAPDGDEHTQPRGSEASNQQGTFVAGHSDAISLAQSPRDSRRYDQIMNCRHTYIFDVTIALMMYGAPTHRLEQYLQLSSQALGISCESCHLPGYMIISLGNVGEPHLDTRVIHREQTLNMSKLYDVHDIYKSVMDKKMSVETAIARLEEVVAHPGKYPLWIRVLMYGFVSASSGVVSFNAQAVDLPIIFVLGIFVGIADLVLAPKSKLSGHIVQVTASILASCIGRGFGSIHWGNNHSFCFAAISQASIVMLLPGFIITNGALELQSKNIISGAVGLVYGIVYTLFISFGFTIGMTIYGAIDHSATSSTKCNTGYGFWWRLIFVLPFTFSYIIISQGKWRKMPPMLAVSLAGWCVTYFSGEYTPAVPSISQALGALTVGVLANIYSRLGNDLAVAIMHPGIYVQVPGSLAASGSLISGLSGADLLIHPNTNSSSSGNTVLDPGFSELDAGYAMVKIAVAITVGLTISVFMVFPCWQTKSRRGIFSL